MFKICMFKASVPPLNLFLFHLNPQNILSYIIPHQYLGDQLKQKFRGQMERSNAYTYFIESEMQFASSTQLINTGLY